MCFKLLVYKLTSKNCQILFVVQAILNVPQKIPSIEQLLKQQRPKSEIQNPRWY